MYFATRAIIVDKYTDLAALSERYGTWSFDPKHDFSIVDPADPGEPFIKVDLDIPVQPKPRRKSK
jgi:hypothetical protein